MSVPAQVKGESGLPRHVAVIMDGNRRWAEARGLPCSAGHRRGVEALRRTVRACGARGLDCLTLYAFSRDNWRRPQEEVEHLMSLVRSYIHSDLAELHRQGVRVRALGAREGLEHSLRALIARAESLTCDNRAMTLAIAFNYSGRDEILRAVRRLVAHARQNAAGAEKLTRADFERHLDTAGMPPPDLIIRTSGEKRLSDFLLWQSAYAEFVFLDALWPDFTEEELDAALAEYRARRRRFGAGEEG